MTPRSARERSWWGWGWADEAVPADQVAGLAALTSQQYGVPAPTPLEPPDPSSLDLPAPRLVPPEPLAPLCSASPRDRAQHAHGRSYRDVVRNLRGEIAHPPDVVARPRHEADVVALLEWAAEAGAAVVPYGGGTSVVGGVECAVPDSYAGVVSLDLTAMDRVLEIDRVSRAARIQAGALGPVLEEQLRPYGLTLRHFPQSFEFSTLGGWLATRAGGHYATVYTHIDDLVESLRVVTPVGVSESRRLPASGAGPSPDRLFLGSEGTLGVITEAWVRVQDRPAHRAGAAVNFPTFLAGAEAVRALSQAALFPTNCRLLDPGEAAQQAGVTDGSAVLVLGFESAHHPVDAALEVALEVCAAHGGTATRTGGSGADAVSSWRGAFLRAPYLRDALARLSVIAETFETACTWDTFPALHASVTAAVATALQEICGAGTVTCRFTHVYPDGPAPYFTVLAPARRGSELAQWAEVKSAASDALLAAGGTITHHHAVGRDHRRWYDAQRPEPFAAALRAAKSALDPGWLLNPGVLVDRS